MTAMAIWQLSALHLLSIEPKILNIQPHQSGLILRPSALHCIALHCIALHCIALILFSITLKILSITNPASYCFFRFTGANDCNAIALQELVGGEISKIICSVNHTYQPDWINAFDYGIFIQVLH